jgi:type II secretion system protein I
MTRARGFTLLEALVALAVLAIGVTAAERLVVRSVVTVSTDADLTRALLAARAVLAEAAVRVPEPGRSEGTRPGGLHVEREVRATAYPRLREIRVRVRPERGGPACELLELVRVPPA